MGKKYFIFDFDGTLCNTNDIIVESWDATFRHFLGETKTRQEIEATFGEILVQTIGRLIPDAAEQEVVDFYRDYQNKHQHGKVYVFPGVREMVTELRARGCLVGVATSRTSYSFWNYMKQFGMEDLVDAVVTMNDVTQHKPHPESVLVALEKLAAEEIRDLAGDSRDPRFIPEAVLDKAVMVGDTKYDIGCANNAGVDSVLVGWSHYINEEDLTENGFIPTYRIDTPDRLLELV